MLEYYTYWKDMTQNRRQPCDNCRNDEIASAYLVLDQSAFKSYSKFLSADQFETMSGMNGFQNSSEITAKVGRQESNEASVCLMNCMNNKGNTEL